MAPAIQIVSIASQQDAIAVLDAVLQNRLDAEIIELDFDSAKWAKLHLGLTGKHFHSSLPASILKTLVEYQYTVYRTVAFVTADRMSGKALTFEERSDLELTFIVSEGSSEVDANGWEVLKAIGLQLVDKMDKKTALILVLSIAILGFGTYTVNSYLHDQASIKIEQIKSDEHIHGIDAVLEATKIGAKERETIIRAMTEVPKISDIKNEFEDAVSEIVRQSSRAETVDVQGVKIPGNAAAELTKNPRAAGKDEIVRGIFTVDTADSVNPQGFTCKIKNLATGEVITAGMYDALMSERDQQVIQGAFWSKRQVELEVHGRRVGQSFRDAKIVKAKFTEQAQTAGTIPEHF